MQKSNLYVKIVTAVLFLAVLGYICVYIYNATQNTYVTASAFSYTLEETVSAHGFVVRSESVMEEVNDATLPIVNEGEKVASGQAVAVEYAGRQALETASEIHELRLRIAQIESTGGEDAVDAASYDSVAELSRAVRGGDLSKLDEISLKIDTYIFTSKRAQADELPELKARLEILESANAGVSMIRSEVSGVFSQAVDGYEHISPDMLDELRPSGLEELFAAPKSISAASAKIITGFKWYYAAIVDAAEALRLTPGKSITLQFSGSYHAQTEMKIESISRREQNACVVLFSSERGIHEVTRLRELNAEIVIRNVTGIRIPKEAMRLDDDGATYIYLQTGARAEKIIVEILSEFADGYLVRDGADNGTPLRPGATIIVKANNLFDGKVVG